MQKVIIKGWLSADQVKSTVSQNDNNTLTQKVRIIEPAFTDPFGDKKGNDQIFDVLFFNDKAKTLPDIQKLAQQIQPDSPVKISITGYVNGNLRKTEDGKEFNNIYISGTEFKVIV